MLERRVEFFPAYDKRSNEPNKNYGIHGVNLRFLLLGPKGVVQFLIHTNWHLPHVQEELDHKETLRFPHLLCHPQPADVGYHSPIPHYEGQSEYDCDLLPGGKCYYDGSSLQANELFNLLVKEGDGAVWKELEERYNDLPEAGNGKGI